MNCAQYFVLSRTFNKEKRAPLNRHRAYKRRCQKWSQNKHNYHHIVCKLTTGESYLEIGTTNKVKTRTPPRKKRCTRLKSIKTQDISQRTITLIGHR